MVGLALSLSAGIHAPWRNSRISAPSGMILLVDQDQAMLLDDDGSYLVDAL